MSISRIYGIIGGNPSEESVKEKIDLTPAKALLNPPVPGTIQRLKIGGVIHTVPAVGHMQEIEQKLNEAIKTIDALKRRLARAENLIFKQNIRTDNLDKSTVKK